MKSLGILNGYENGEFNYTVEVPEGISASFGGEELEAGKNIFAIKEVI